MTFSKLISNLILAAMTAYWPSWIFGIIIILIDFFVLKSKTQTFIITVLSFTAAAAIIHEMGHIIGIKIIAKLPFGSIQIISRLFQITLNHPPIDKNFWMIVASGSLMNILIGAVGWLIIPDASYRFMWTIFQISFGIINLMPFSPDGEKLFAYFKFKEQV